MQQQQPTTSEHDQGVPTWPAWRILYALWRNADDARTRWSVVKGGAAQLRARLIDRAN